MSSIEETQRELGITLDSERMPRHIAIIMDGNGRWATQRGLPRAMGHAQGYVTIQGIAQACSDLGVGALTLYAFSTENWRRPKDEVDALMQLIEYALRQEVPTLQKNKIRLQTIGRIWELPQSLQDTIAEITAETAQNSKLILNLAINYGGRREILDAVQEASRRVLDGEIDRDAITEEYFSNLMYTAGLPDPDLLIRTAGELRVSNYLLWQIAYSEIHVTSTLWPDFGDADLIKAIADYQSRIRKFGTVPPPVGS